MTQFHIKLLAAIFMVIDHIGVVFFPGDPAFRVVGRLSFPLFAWLLAQGEQHTQDIRRYLGRLLIMALISQPLYSLLFEVRQLNILVTLALGLVVIRLGKQFPDYRYPFWGVGIVLAGLIPMDAGAYGLCVILLIAAWKPNQPQIVQLCWWLMWIMLHLLYVLALELSSVVQLWAIPTPLLLYFTHQARGPKARWFYIFYPGHLALLLGVASQG